MHWCNTHTENGCRSNKTHLHQAFYFIYHSKCLEMFQQPEKKIIYFCLPFKHERIRCRIRSTFPFSFRNLLLCIIFSLCFLHTFTLIFVLCCAPCNIEINSKQGITFTTRQKLVCIQKRNENKSKHITFTSTMCSMLNAILYCVSIVYTA